MKLYNATQPNYKRLFYRCIKPGKRRVHRCMYIYCQQSAIWRCQFCNYETHKGHNLGNHYQRYHSVQEWHTVRFTVCGVRHVAAVLWDVRTQRVMKMEVKYSTKQRGGK